MTLTPDEALLIDKFRRAKQMRHADVTLSVKDARLAKLEVTEKVDLSGIMREPRS